jgi:hypothetical protein
LTDKQDRKEKGMQELVVVWENGDTDVYEYINEAEAEQHGRDMKTALGNQIAWWGTRRKVG